MFAFIKSLFVTQPRIDMNSRRVVLTLIPTHRDRCIARIWMGR